jgi:hypothetical protein
MRFYQQSEDIHALDFQSSKSIQDLIDFNIRTQPHGFLHIGYMSRILSENGLDNSRCLSIGICPIKDVMLSKLNHLNFIVTDIDIDLVYNVNQFVKGKFDNVRYVNYRTGSDELKSLMKAEQFDILFLSQMDYTLSNDDLSRIVIDSFETNVKNIIVITPSLHSFLTARNPLLIIRNFIDYSLDILSSIKTYKFYSSGIYSRRRLFWRFNKFFTRYYNLSEKIIYQYPSGRMHLLLYVKRSVVSG